MTPGPQPRWLTPVTLSGAHVRLEPLSARHLDGLIEAARDGELWKLWYTTVPSPAGMAGEIDRRLGLARTGTMLPFAVFDTASQTVAGMTTYMNVDAENRRVEIGSTWYRQLVRRSALNTEAKLLLLGHAFERLDCIAVEFRTSSFNLPSRRAIERLGAKLDGVLRNHAFHQDGSLRDTHVYSIIAGEWPAVRSHLRYELDRDRTG
ncbi:MAG: GNAT family N-acetyltransferase [Vulcanimicrobiaceae bacterium]